MAIKKNPSYWVVIPASVRYNRTLSAGAKLMFGELMALATTSGFAFPSNKWLGCLYGISSRQVSRLIGELVDSGFIVIDNPSNTKRRIYIVNNDHVTSLNIAESVLPSIDNYGDHSITRVIIKDNNDINIKELFKKVYKK